MNFYIIDKISLSHCLGLKGVEYLYKALGYLIDGPDTINAVIFVLSLLKPLEDIGFTIVFCNALAYDRFVGVIGTPTGFTAL